MDGNTTTITGAVRNRDIKTLEAGYDKYLGYASGETEYTGGLSKDQLQSEADRYRKYMNQVGTLLNADKKLFTAEILRDARTLTENNSNGLPFDPSEEQRVVAELAAFRAADPDNVSLYNASRDLDRSITVRSVFRDEITNIPDGQTFTDVVASFNEALNASDSKMSAEDRNVMYEVSGKLASFQRKLNDDPMAAIREYGLDDQFTHPIRDIDFSDSQSLASDLALREQSYQYYQGVYNFNGDMLTEPERSELNGILSDESLPDQVRLNYMVSATAGLRRGHEKFWGPSVSDQEYGQYAALGMMMNDYQEMGNANQGFMLGQKTLQGFRILKEDPTIVEDYQDSIDEIRRDFGSAYNAFPGVRKAYLDMAIAHTVATAPNGRRLSDFEDSLEKVTGGMLEHGGVTFLTPKPGMRQAELEEYLHEYNPANFGNNVAAYTDSEVAAGLRDESIRLQPTGRSRTSFYLLSGPQTLMDKRTKRPYVFTYDESADKRFTRR